ncbi:MAG: carboxylesterase family protein [Tannerellaceae bacterium]|nr:carboxylesterase family protein [Tannerellaceae bacterium]
MSQMMIRLFVCMMAVTTMNASGMGEERILTFPNGKTIKYRAYETIYYVSNVVDSTYQYLNYYVPESAYENRNVPVFLKTNVGGYMAAKAAAPSPTDATGRALQEGYVVVIPGARGSNATVLQPDGATVYTGRAPAGLVDLKAAIRYLRSNDASIPGDKERIITDGTSAGGAMSSLLGATGNHPAYESYMQELGADAGRDDIFAAVCFCPITDLEHADMAYEWLYKGTNAGVRGLSTEQIAVSEELAALYPAYLNSLELKTPDGTVLTDVNYRDYLKTFLIKSAQKAHDAGADIPAETGIVLNQGRRGSTGEFVIDVDLDTYLEYVVKRQQLKAPPAFDPLNVLENKASPENSVFGDHTGNAVNFTGFSLQKATNNPSAVMDTELKDRVWLMNPMNFIGDGISRTAQNWYIRHGAADRDTGFQIPVNLATKLINHHYNVNFDLVWNRGHTGDYGLDELFAWIKEITTN